MFAMGVGGDGGGLAGLSHGSEVGLGFNHSAEDEEGGGSSGLGSALGFGNILG